MIKLQLLLRHRAAHPGIAPALQAQLDALGLHVTACGRASISAEAGMACAAKLFGPLPPLESGFGPLSAPALPVPPGLADAISLITVAPQHAAPCQPP